MHIHCCKTFMWCYWVPWNWTQRCEWYYKCQYGLNESFTFRFVQSIKLHSMSVTNFFDFAFFSHLFFVFKFSYCFSNWFKISFHCIETFQRMDDSRKQEKKNTDIEIVDLHCFAFCTVCLFTNKQNEFLFCEPFLRRFFSSSFFYRQTNLYVLVV